MVITASITLNLDEIVLSLSLFFFTLKCKMVREIYLLPVDDREELAMLSMESSRILVTCNTQGIVLKDGHACKDKELGVLQRGWRRSLCSCSTDG
jgi:hypothetical protein